MSKGVSWVAWLLLLWLAAPLQAQTLRWSARGDALSMDPHAALEAVTFNISTLVYDRLVEFNAQGDIEPALATGWTLVNPGTWRFALRRGVKFQDGTPFTADDAVFSIRRAQQPTSKFARYALRLGQPVRIDDATLELKLEQPNPQLLAHLSYILVMSRAWAVAHQAEQAADPAAKAEAYSTRHAMGTGRYLLRQYDPGVRTLLARNPGWWGRMKGNVEQIVYTPIASDATRTAALLAGDVDLMQDVPTQDAPRLAQEASVRLLRGEENRLIFLGFDQFRDELLYASVKGRNPFKDARVREAFYRAIDVDALKASVMRGESRPTGCIATAAAGCLATETEAHPRADLPRARRLMAEAGYAEGFDLTMDCPNDRYINDRSICVAVGGMLARIGVRLRVDARTKTQFFPKVQRFDSSFYLHGYGYAMADAQDFLDAAVHGQEPVSRKGDVNFGRFDDAELDRWLDASQADMDPARRAGLIRDAQRRVSARYYILPLHRQMLTWAARSNVHPVMTPDNTVRVDWIRID